MDPVTAELRELAQMNVVSERKKSFGAVTIEAQLETAAITRQRERGKSTSNQSAPVTAAVTTYPPAIGATHTLEVEPINCTAANENRRDSDSEADDEDIFVAEDSSDDQLSESPSPRVISPELSRVDFKFPT